MKTHVVKSWPQFFAQIATRRRTHELRRNDRNYRIGDFLELREYEPGSDAYTGRVCKVEITSVTSAQEPCAASEEALHRDFCILSISRIGTLSC